TRHCRARRLRSASIVGPHTARTNRISLGGPVGRNRRQQRLRDRKSRGSDSGSNGTPRPSTGGGGSLSRPRKPAWRETLDAWGGFTVVGAIAAAVVIGALLVFLNRPG